MSIINKNNNNNNSIKLNKDQYKSKREETVDHLRISFRKKKAFEQELLELDHEETLDTFES